MIPKFIRFVIMILCLLVFSLLAMEVFFVVTNSDNTDFEAGVPQDMSSGLFNSYVREDDFDKMKSKCGLLVDFDLDGDLDIAFGYESFYYFRNIGDGMFEDITQNYDIENQGVRGLVSADFDNNGYNDILKWRFEGYEEIDSLREFIQDTRMTHNLLMNNGSHDYEMVNYMDETSLINLHSQGLMDVDLDGDVDIVAIEKLGADQFRVFINNGFNDGQIQLNESFSYAQFDSSSSRTLAIADYDNDGDQDVFVARKYGINWLFQNQTLTENQGYILYNPNPSPLFIQVAEEYNIQDDSFERIGSMGYGAAWGDYDNDNDLDLYLSNWGPNRLFRNDGDTFTDIAADFNLTSEELSNGAGWGDFNNDGRLDIWAANIREHDDVFINLGDQWTSEGSPDFLSATQDVVTADYNGDGWLDSFNPGLEMASPAPNGDKYTGLLYKNVTQDSTLLLNNWVKIDLEGAMNTISNSGWTNKSNKSAVGARVLVHSGSNNISREIIAGKGHGSMDALQLHFGVGDISYIEGITIHWPSRDISTNQPKVSYYDGPFETNKSYRIVEDIGFVGVKGDANSDENVNILDVMNLIDIILHDTTLTTEIIWAMDLDSTESLNILDVTKLVHFILFH